MPDFEQKLTRLGFTNNHWGVCGFTSCLYAMYDLSPGTRFQTINASSAYRILAEIKTYLVMLKAEGSCLLNEIRDFTRSFGGVFANFDIDPYISRINQAAAKGLTRRLILHNELYSIALPPRAVADYFKRMWGRKTKVSEFQLDNGQGDGVIGVTSSEYDTTTKLKKPYYGLEHYMYRRRGKIYSWGQSFNSVQEAWYKVWDPAVDPVVWRVCYVIHVPEG